VCVNGNTAETLQKVKPRSRGYGYSLRAYETMDGEGRIACGMLHGDVEMFDAVTCRRLQTFRAFHIECVHTVIDVQVKNQFKAIPGRCL
jgi:hypothetical protein